MKDRPLRHRVEYGLYLALKGFLRALPPRGARAFGRGLGSLAHRLDRRHREVALRNMALALPETGEAERRRLVRECFRHFGAALCDAVSSTRFAAVGSLPPLQPAGLGAPRRGGEPRQGNLHPHRPPGVLGAGAAGHRPDPGPHGHRRPAGRQPLPRPRAARPARALRQRRHPQAGRRAQDAGVAARPRPGGHPDRSAGAGARRHRRALLRPAGPHQPRSSRASLCARAPPVVPITAYPEPGGKYRIVVRPPILPPEGEEGEEAVAALTRRYLETAEEDIREHPEMWLWMHRRWDERKKEA